MKKASSIALIFLTLTMAQTLWAQGALRIVFKRVPFPSFVPQGMLEVFTSLPLFEAKHDTSPQALILFTMRENLPDLRIAGITGSGEDELVLSHPELSTEEIQEQCEQALWLHGWHRSSQHERTFFSSDFANRE